MPEGSRIPRACQILISGPFARNSVSPHDMTMLLLSPEQIRRTVCQRRAAGQALSAAPESRKGPKGRKGQKGQNGEFDQLVEQRPVLQRCPRNEMRREENRGWELFDTRACFL